MRFTVYALDADIIDVTANGDKWATFVPGNTFMKMVGPDGVTLRLPYEGEAPKFGTVFRVTVEEELS